MIGAIYHNQAGREPPALVLGGGVTALGTARALAAAGVVPLLLASAGHLARRSRHARLLPGEAPPGDDPAALETFLGRLPVGRAVLVPCSDSWARTVARLSGEAAARFPAATATPEALDRLVDKARFARALEELGVPHPVTRLLPEASALAAVPDPVFGSAFLKPLDSQACFARFGVKGFWIRSREEAAARHADLAAAGVAVLLQEYVPGGADRHWFLDGFRDRAGRTTGLLVRQRRRMYPPDFGNSSAMVSTPPSAAAPAVESLHRLLDGIGYRGPFSAEFKQDARDGVFRLLEVNARMWWYVEFAARCGVNVPRLAWADALGRDDASPDSYQVGKWCIYPRYDWHATRALRGRSPLRWASWMAAALRAEQPVFAWRDPAPALAEAALTAAARLRRLLPGPPK